MLPANHPLGSNWSISLRNLSRQLWVSRSVHSWAQTAPFHHGFIWGGLSNYYWNWFQDTIQNNGKIVKIQVWDTAGQERFKTISKSFYKIANGVILVFDLTSENTFNNIKQWILELNKNTDENIIKILVGNKLDLEKQRKIPYSSAIEFAEKNNMKYIETSNKNHINIDKVFLILVDLIISRIDDYLSTQDNISNIKQIELFSSMDQTEQKSRCCL